MCSRPGCPNLVDAGRCADHERTDDARRGSSRARGYNSRWERTRAKHLTNSPLCTECGVIGSVVDHIDGLGPLGPRGHDHDNLRTLCKPCHDRRTARDQPGGWNRR